MVEGSGPEQMSPSKGLGTRLMSPELENNAFSAKSTQYMHLKRHKDSHNTVLETRKQGM